MKQISELDTFIADYPVFEYRIIDTDRLRFEPRVRMVCEQECPRYNSTWACPPAVGELQECREKCMAYPEAVFFFHGGGSQRRAESGRNTGHQKGA